MDTLDDILQLSADDMARVNGCIREALASDVVLIDQVMHYIVGSGGKRLRPLLLVISARACGYTGEQHYPLAAIVEFIHTATLLHDDVVDESDSRRGKKTAHAVWGNAAAVLVGDFLYSRSFQMMVRLDSMRIMQILADTTNTIAEGEVLQLLNMGDPEVNEAAYLKVIDDKTARLFEAACRLGAVVSGQPEPVEEALARYGQHLGRAFQLADDLLDYTGDAQALGKNVGDDLAEGKPTLPLIYARTRCEPEERELIDTAIRDGGLDQLDQILAITRRTGALEATAERARAEADTATAALDGLADSDWKRALVTLARLSYDRDR
nr:octaprenyl diphosphate synthase [Marinihelvus fidelis]